MTIFISPVTVGLLKAEIHYTSFRATSL